MIRKAALSEIDALMAIAKACAQDMISKGIFQWNEHYPGKETFVNDIKNKELYVLFEDQKLIGCIVISKIKDIEYGEIKWLTPDSNNLYIHRLAVHPNHQGKGFARKLMDFAEDLATSSGAASIRLDTFSQNKRNQRFYESRGYTRLGNVFFPNQSEYPFYCYELPLPVNEPAKSNR